MVKPFYKPLDRPEREEIWYCYYIPREKPDSKPIQRVPISQVPDLTNETARLVIKNAEENKYLNVGRVSETDSKYVKLAKTGGRKNLLCYKENERRNSEPRRYKVPDWYYHDNSKVEEQELSEEEKHKRYRVTYGKRCYKISQLKKPEVYQRPDYMTYLEPEELIMSLGTSNRIPDRPIFGFDKFSFWKRDEEEKLDKLPPLVVKENAGTTSALLGTSKKVVPMKKKVKLAESSKKSQMSSNRKLFSSSYATEWHEKWSVKALRK